MKTANALAGVRFENRDSLGRYYTRSLDVDPAGGVVTGELGSTQSAGAYSPEAIEKLSDGELENVASMFDAALKKRRSRKATSDGPSQMRALRDQDGARCEAINDANRKFWSQV